MRATSLMIGLMIVGFIFWMYCNVLPAVHAVQAQL